mmetsp:Transcript_10183/g.22532  ORF Transcript_10183/g.22532 Transcript_10183/m.22532 type:complete len:883 (-) Transcript_10183:242-2890(-)
MGVPGFYRWAVKRVPGVRHKASKAPWVCDHLYLDFNGVVHSCIDEWGGHRDEELLFELITAHILALVEMCNPRVLLYIALDGVAPRAKMNQQRSRRFRAAKDAAEAVTGPKFDRNAITPGTDFMVRLSAALQRWVAVSASLPALAGVTIVISDDRDPGEGEHKIMEVIRNHPNDSHILVSSDADLVFLGLVCPAEHVFLLRQDQSARRQAEARASGVPREGHDVNDDYELLSVVAVRKFLASKFPLCVPTRVAWDFVAMCCLAGNDFLPHIPALDIYQGGIDKLLDAYTRADPAANGYLVGEDLSLQLLLWQVLLQDFAAVEAELLLEEAGLGWGPRVADYKGPGPPSDEWDGLSVHVLWAPPRCQSSDVITSLSKAGCTVASAVQVKPKGGQANQTGPTFWLVRFTDAKAALKTIVSQRRVRANKVICNWVLPNKLEYFGEAPEACQAVPWKAERDELILESFDYWFSAANLETDAYLKRHVFADPDHFVPLKVFLKFQRLRGLQQDIDEIAKVLRASGSFEVRGSGETLAVRAVKDHSTKGKASAHTERLQKAAQAVAGGRPVDAVDILRQVYYAKHRGPAFEEPSKEQDADCTLMEHNRSHAFLQGIEWVVKYYVRGCASWSWFFPAHYPPLCVSLMQRTADPLQLPPLHAPFPPLLQLMAVLPPQSGKLLPQQLQPLLDKTSSPIADFYPLDFEVDRKEDDKEWQGVALLPFVDEARLRCAVEAVMPNALESPPQPAHAFLHELPKAPGTGTGGEESPWAHRMAAHFVACCSLRQGEGGLRQWDFKVSAPLPPGIADAPQGRAATRPEVAAAAAKAPETSKANGWQKGGSGKGKGSRKGGSSKGKGGSSGNMDSAGSMASRGSGHSRREKANPKQGAL